MSYILAGENKVAIVSYGVRRHDNKRGLVLTITATKDNISLTDLDDLCETIRAEKLDILVYNDSDELETTLRGFHHNCIVSKDTSGNLTAEITNESENTYQIGLLQDRSTRIETTASAQTQAINTLNTVTAGLGEQINTQSESIAAQSEQMAMTEETVAMQMATMDSLLVDALPIIIADAVTIAVQEALGSNSTTEETLEDTEVVE